MYISKIFHIVSAFALGVQALPTPGEADEAWKISKRNEADEAWKISK